MVCGVVDNYPRVWAFVTVGCDMSDVGPEAGISLWGWPYPFDDIVVDERVIWQPLNNAGALQRGWKGK